jgi:hypothetical protein
MILKLYITSRESYTINQTANRLPATLVGSEYQVNPADQPNGE